MPSRQETDSDRLIALDFVRGVAVLGILLLNIVGFAWPEAVTISPRAPTAPVSAADDWTWATLFVLADGKFRGLFSLLFGASLLLFVERAEAAGEDGEALQRRRLAWLALFGLAHGFLLWWGDILFLYAVCGFVVLTQRHQSVATLASAALALYLAGALGLAALTAIAAFDPVLGAETTATYAAEARAEIAMTLAGWPAQVLHALRDNWSDPLWSVAMTWVETVPLMLLGMALFKAGLFAGEWDSGTLRRWAAGGIIAGLALTLPLVWWLWRAQFSLPLTLFVWLGPAPIARLASILGYAALLVLLVRGGAAASALGRRIVACGRMAFSNYIATSLVMTFIFHGWGLGLFARVGRFELLGFVLFGWTLMLAWSEPWLKRFRHGPLEWLWRSLTYRRLAPMRYRPNKIP